MPRLVGAASDDPDRRPSRTVGATSDTGWVPDGWRVESWGDLTWAVPRGWGYGTIDQWCADRGDRRPEGDVPAPVVQRPHGVSTLVGCHPRRGLGVEVSVGAAAPPTEPKAYVAGAAVGQRRFGKVALTVSTSSAPLTEQVLATGRRFEDLDANGCAGSARPVPVGDGGGVPAPQAGEPLSVCRYVRVAGEWVLDQSERLSAGDSRRAWEALGEAPAGSGPDADPEDCGGWPAEQVVQLRTPAQEVAWVHYDGCTGRGVQLLGVGSRSLTEEVLQWSISPGWSGGWDGSVPMPDRLRELSR